MLELLFNFFVAFVTENVLTMCSQFSHNVLTAFSQYAHNVLTVCSQFTHNVLTVCSQCANTNVTDCHIVTDEEKDFLGKFFNVTEWHSQSVHKMRKLHNGEKYT